MHLVKNGQVDLHYTKIHCLIDRLLLESFNIAAIPSLIITQCCDPILGGRGGTISILKGKSWNYREHTILLSRKRINKGIKRMNSLPLFLVAFSYETWKTGGVTASRRARR